MSNLPAVLKKKPLALIERELVAANGNVVTAARRLNLPANELRGLIRRMPYLLAATLEGVERAIDEAEAVLLEGLRAEPLETRLSSAQWLLKHSPAARKRGWTRDHHSQG